MSDYLPYPLDFKRYFTHLPTVQGYHNGSKCESSHLPPQKDERDYLMAIREGYFLQKIVKMWILRHIKKGADTLKRAASNLYIRTHMLIASR